MKKFRMRKKPAEPRPKTIEKEVDLSYDISLKEVLSRVPSGVDPDDVELRADMDGYMTMHYTMPEPKEDFMARVEVWQSKVREYEQWEREHAEEIQALQEEKTRKNAGEVRRTIQELEQRLQKEKERLASLSPPSKISAS